VCGIVNQMGVAHRHVDALMPHQRFDAEYVRLVHSKPARKCVAKRMENDAALPVCWFLTGS